MIKKYLGRLRVVRSVILNYYADYKLFINHSLYRNKKSFENLEADLILNYHSIEKGLLFENTRPYFAKERVMKLHKILIKDSIISNVHKSQVKVGYQVMCEYFELHQKLGFEIKDFYTIEQYYFYKSKLACYYQPSFSGAIEFERTEFYNSINTNFQEFSNSRKSIRNFTGEKIDIERIKTAIDLAKNAPSVCNRQASKVYLVEDKLKIDKILKIQGGFTGYSENVSQLLILTNDRSYYYTLGERNQFYIDGGLFLLNLLYALHFYKIANCPANWGKLVQEEKLLDHVIKIPKAEKIICMIPIGEAVQNFKVTLSKRRDTEEILKIV